MTGAGSALHAVNHMAFWRCSHGARWRSRRRGPPPQGDRSARRSSAPRQGAELIIVADGGAACGRMGGVADLGVAAERLVWSDTFDRPSGSVPDPEVWVAEVGGGGWGDAQLQTYTAPPANASIT